MGGYELGPGPPLAEDRDVFGDLIGPIYTSTLAKVQLMGTEEPSMEQLLMCILQGFHFGGIEIQIVLTPEVPVTWSLFSQATGLCAQNANQQTRTRSSELYFKSGSIAIGNIYITTNAMFKAYNYHILCCFFSENQQVYLDDCCPGVLLAFPLVLGSLLCSDDSNNHGG